MVIMPSGMRRASRVFGVVKGADGARVLRSGRRLFPDSGEAKLRRAGDEEWLQSSMKNSTLKGKENGWAQKDSKLKEEKKIDYVINEEPKKKSNYNSRRSGKRAKIESEKASKNIKNEARNKKKAKIEKKDSAIEREKRMFGAVYTRKRQRLDGEKVGDKMFGIQFLRRQRRRKEDGVLSALVERDCTCGFECFLVLFLRYAKRVELRVSELAAFLCSEPISSVFAANGIRFLLGRANQLGVCKFFGPGEFVPMFSVDFSAIPLCFMSMHRSLSPRINLLSCVPPNNTLDEDTSDDEMMSEREVESSILTKTVVPEPKTSGSKLTVAPSVRSSRLAGINAHYKNGLYSRGIRKRRSSLRRRRGRNPSVVGTHKANGALVSDLITSRKNGIPFSAVVSKNKLSDSLRSSSAANLKKMTLVAVGKTQDTVGATQDMDFSSCSANILVIEADRCYRIQGASITLEISDSREWVLAVKKDGSIRYTLLAQKNMRAHSSNRYTHDIIWNADENWRLEFPNRHDWFIFKDLYKECSDRNITVPNIKTIPVPGVREVPGYEDGISAPFSRPEAYISVNNDEIARALSKRTAIYDMDSEDEEWLREFNDYLFVESERREHLSEDNFELMIDTFERAVYCSPDDLTGDNTALNKCKDFGGREVVEAVNGFWMKKRKQKRSSLLRVFQVAKKAPLIPKPVLRKKRSFKRQVSQFGRGKQPNILQVMAAEHDALEEQNVMIKVEEAKNAAMKSMETAILKRRRAQVLMENADLATFKASMALRIAEAARVTDSSDVVAYFLDGLV